MKQILKQSVFIVAAVILITVIVLLLHRPAYPEKTGNSSLVSWIGQQASFEEACGNATQIIYAKTQHLESYLYKGVVFTNAEVEITEALKGNLIAGEKCKIFFTGGILEGKDHRVVPLPEEGKNYLFLVEERENAEGKVEEYIPVGGYQGVLKMEAGWFKRIFGAEDTDIKVTDFNIDNCLETEMKGKTLAEIKKQIP